MSDQKDLGIIIAVLNCFERQRLPHLLQIKTYLDKGEKLNDRDIVFLVDLIKERKTITPEMERIINKKSEFKQLEVNIISLYHYIAVKALSNEKNEFIN